MVPFEDSPVYLKGAVNMKRRALLSISAVAALVLTACSDSDSGSTAATTSATEGSPVTFVHPSIEDLEIEFAAQPETLVMDCYAYSSLHEYGIEPAALFGFECDNPLIMGDADVSGIERVGEDGEIDVEKLAEVRPDAIIGNGKAEGWSWFDDDVNAQLTRVANFIPLPSGGSVDENIANTREIATFLGSDSEAENITRADEDFEAAKEEFANATKDKELNFLMASPSKEMLYSGTGFAQSDLLGELGATIVGPDAPATGNPWAQVAWEEASTYPADVILIEGFDPDNAFSADLWDTLPAVEAEQISGWYSKGAMTSRAYADWLSDLAEKTTNYSKVS